MALTVIGAGTIAAQPKPQNGSSPSAPAGRLGSGSSEAAADEAPIRVGLRARNGGADRLTSLRYIGGFETKTMLLETLVRRGPDGRIEGALASNWAVEDGGKAWVLRLRDGARFHDGSPVTAEAVRTHFRRWMNLPEHDWLRVNRHLTGVEALSEREVRVTLDRPYALLEDLLAINPCAIVGPAAKDWEGEFVRPIGTGPFRFEGAHDGGKRWRLVPVAGGGPPLDVTFYPRGRDETPIDDLLQGRIDAFVGGWDEDLPAERLTALEQDARYRVVTAPGSSVVYLTFRIDEGPTRDVAVRRRIQRAIDRAELLRVVEGERADPCTTWAAPSVLFWPAGPETVRLRRGEGAVTAAAALATAPEGPPVKLRVAPGHGEGRASRVAMEVAAQLARVGFEVEFVAAPPRVRESPRRVVDATGAVAPLTTESGEVRAAAAAARRARTRDADVRVEITHGMPYCPHQSLVARFGAPRAGARERSGGTPELEALVEEAAATPLERDRAPIYARIQTLMDREAIVVPLYVPWRVAIHVAGVDGIHLGPDVYHADLTGLHRVVPR